MLHFHGLCECQVRLPDTLQAKKYEMIHFHGLCECQVRLPDTLQATQTVTDVGQLVNVFWLGVHNLGDTLDIIFLVLQFLLCDCLHSHG